METLPNELLLHIMKQCSLHSLLLFRELSTKYLVLANSTFRQKKKIDFYSSYFCCAQPSEKKLHLQKFTRFAQHYCGKLQELVFTGCPVSLTLGNLIELASIKTITKLDFGQLHHLPEIHQSALLALPYFDRLKSINLNGLPLFLSVGTGGKHHYDTPPLHRLPGLEEFSLTCKTGILFRTIQAIHGKNYIMPNLKSVHLGNRFWVTMNDSDFALLIWFFRQHELLEEVELSEFMFATSRQIEELWSCLLRLRRLRKLSLKKCSSRDTTGLVGFQPTIQCRNLEILQIVDSAASVNRNLVQLLKRRCPAVIFNEIYIVD